MFAISRGILTIALCLSCGGSPSRRSPPDVVLITLDTTRADHLGCYGYEHETSPNLDALAAESRVYTRAYTPSSWTLPAHASLFTGRFPSSHGAMWDSEGELILGAGVAGPQTLQHLRARGLTASQPTLAEVLTKASYTTGAVVAGPWLKRIFGLDRGFQHYDHSGIETLRGRIAASVTNSAIEWLDRNPSGPLFLFLNYYDPHGPYSDPEGLAERFARAVPEKDELTEVPPRGARYDGEILYMDQHLGRLLDHLREIGRYETSWIIVTADHGELLGEHGKTGHGEHLFEGEIRIPLIVKAPAVLSSGTSIGSVGRSTAAVGLIDVFPMILDALGIEAPPNVQGGLPPDVGHPIFAEVYPQPMAAPLGDWRVIFDGDFKLHWNSLGAHLLYDVRQDPDEESNLLFDKPERAMAMTSLLNAFVGALPKREAIGDEAKQVDDETLRALESLGYLPSDKELPPQNR